MNTHTHPGRQAKNPSRAQVALGITARQLAVSAVSVRAAYHSSGHDVVVQKPAGDGYAAFDGEGVSAGVTFDNAENDGLIEDFPRCGSASVCGSGKPGYGQALVGHCEHQHNKNGGRIQPGPADSRDHQSFIREKIQEHCGIIVSATLTISFRPEHIADTRPVARRPKTINGTYEVVQ